MKSILFKKENLPGTITSYDIFKTIAVLLMVIDHVGLYLYPEELWFRVFGRICVPIWFFLIGYSKSQRVPASFWIGAVALLALNLAMGYYFTTLNILFTMIAVRYALAPLMRRTGTRPWLIYFFILVCGILFPFTNILSEYGTMGLGIAAIGYMARHKETYEPSVTLNAAFITITLYLVLSNIGFHFDLAQNIVAGCGSVAALAAMIYYFPKPRTYPSLDASGILRPVLQLTGRHTLPIYVVHVAILKLASAWLQ